MTVGSRRRRSAQADEQRELESRVNQAFKHCFRGKPGELVLNYLESISTRKALAPPYDQVELNHLEGARWLMAHIKNRIEMGKQGLPQNAEVKSSGRGQPEPGSG